MNIITCPEQMPLLFAFATKKQMRGIIKKKVN
jgi:hypothetical protein